MRTLSSAAPVALLIASLLTPCEAQGTDPELQTGIRQIADGDFQAALLTLDGVVRKLTPDTQAHAKELAQAFLYKGVACVGLAQEEPAKASFRQALTLDKELRLSAKEFPLRVVRVFEAARKGRSKSVLYAGGGIGLGAIAAAFAAGGGAVAAAVASGPTRPWSASFISSNPVPGSTISLASARAPRSAGQVLALTFSLSGPPGFSTTVLLFLRRGQTNCLQLAGDNRTQVNLSDAGRATVTATFGGQVDENFGGDCATPGNPNRTADNAWVQLPPELESQSPSFPVQYTFID